MPMRTMALTSKWCMQLRCSLGLRLCTCNFRVKCSHRASPALSRTLAVARRCIHGARQRPVTTGGECNWALRVQVLPDAEQPAEIVMPLLPYQRKFLGWALGQERSGVRGGILADEMGMGKTLQACMLASPP